MPVGWLTVLKLVPWVEVIKNAPAIADGAKKLWTTVGRSAPLPDAPAGTDVMAADAAVAADPASALTALQARVVHAEAAVAELQAQMQASSELIKSLAEQNAELVSRVETNRSRTVWLFVLLGVVVAIAAFKVAMN